MPRSGEIGEQIFEQTEQLVKSGMNRTQAFAEIAEESGRQAGTVAANYYRVARKRADVPVQKSAQKVEPSRVKTPKAPSRRDRPRSSDGGDVDRLANELIENVELLAKALKAQEAEIRDLRARLEGVRSALN